MPGTNDRVRLFVHVSEWSGKGKQHGHAKSPNRRVEGGFPRESDRVPSVVFVLKTYLTRVRVKGAQGGASFNKEPWRPVSRQTVLKGPGKGKTMKGGPAYPAPGSELEGGNREAPEGRGGKGNYRRLFWMPLSR